MTLFKKKKQEPEEIPAETTGQSRQPEDTHPDKEHEVAENPETEPETEQDKEPEVADTADSAKVATSKGGPDQPDESEQSGQSGTQSFGLDPSDPLLPLLTTLRGELESGMISDESRELLNRTLNYDQDMIRAKAEGELAGRNAAIEEHLLTQDDSDGVPHPGCGQGASTSAHRFSIFDLARDAMM